MKRLLISLILISLPAAQAVTVPEGDNVVGPVAAGDGENATIAGVVRDAIGASNVEKEGSGDVTVTDTAVIRDADGDGVNVDTDGADAVTVSNSGVIRDNDQAGIDLQADGNASITAINSGIIRNNFEGVEIEANENTTGAATIHFTNTADGRIRNSSDDGIDIDDTDSNSTVTVINDGVIRNFGADGIEADPEDNATLTIINNGTIHDPDGFGGAESDGIDVDSDDQSVTTITNTGRISDVADDGIDIQSNDQSSITVNNSGTIRDTGEDGIDLDEADDQSMVTIHNSGNIFDTGESGIESNADVDAKVTIQNSGIIRDTGTAGIEVNTDGNSSTTVNNSGTIRDTGNEGILIGATSTSTVTVNNSGEIRDADNELIQGNLSGNAHLQVTNSGVLNTSQFGSIVRVILDGSSSLDFTNTASGLIANPNAGRDAVAIQVNDASTARFTNHGTIRNAGRAGIDINVTAGGGMGTIVNTGTISNSTNNGIDGFVSGTGPGMLTVNNSGIIRNSGGDGMTFNGFGGAIINVTNSGIIRGSGSGTSIRFDDTDNTLTITGRSEIQNLIDGGTESVADILNIIGRGLTDADIASIQALAGDGAQTFSFHGNNHDIVEWEIYNFTFEQYATLLPDHLQDFGTFLDSLNPTPDFLREVLNFLDLTPAGESLNHAVSNLTGLDGIEQYKREAFQWGPGVSRSLGQYFHNLRQGGTGWDTSNVALYDPNLPIAMQPMAQRRMVAGTSMVDGNTDPIAMAKVIDDANAPATDWGGFAIVRGTYSEQDANTDFADAEATSAQINLGLDKRIDDNLAVGAMAGYTRTDADVDGLESEVIDNSVNVGLYAHYSEGNSFIEGMIGYRAHFYEYDRNIIAAPGATATSDTVGHQLPISIRVGHDFKFGEERNWTFTPQAALHYSLLYVDGYTESGAGALNLIVDDYSAQSLQTEVGFRLARRYTGNYGWFSPSLYASYNHEFLDENTSVSSRFSGGLTPFSVQTADPERDFAVLGLALDGSPADYPNLHFGIRYDVQVGQDDYISHSAAAHMRVDL